MRDTAVQPAPDTSPNIGDLVEDALHQAKSLVQAELSLARRELKNELSAALGALSLLVLGVLFFGAAITTLGVLLVGMLGWGVAALGVVAAQLAIGAAIIVVAVRTLGQRKLPRTQDRLSADARQVLETMK